MQLKALLSCFGRTVAERGLARPASSASDRENTPRNSSLANLLQPETASAAKLPHDPEQLDPSLGEGLGSRFQVDRSTAGERDVMEAYAPPKARAAIAAAVSDSAYRRDAMICSRMPAAVTVFNQLGQVIHQNSASIFYLGDLINSSPPSIDVLSLVFQLEPEKLDRMLRDMDRESGGRWRGIVRVPTSLVAALGPSQRILDSASTATAGARSSLTARVLSTSTLKPHTRSGTAATVIVDTSECSPHTVLPGQPTGQTSMAEGEAVRAPAVDNTPTPQAYTQPPLPPQESSSQAQGDGPGVGVRGQASPAADPGNDAVYGAALTLQQPATDLEALAAFTISPAGPAPPRLAVFAAEAAAEAHGTAPAVAAGGRTPAADVIQPAASLTARALRVAVPESAGKGCVTPLTRDAGSTQASGTAALVLDSSQPRSVSHQTPVTGTTGLTANEHSLTSQGHFMELSATNTSRIDFPEAVLIRQPGLVPQKEAPCPIKLVPAAALDTAAAADDDITGTVIEEPAIERSFLWDAGADPLATSTFGLALRRNIETAPSPFVVHDAASTAVAAGTSTGLGGGTEHAAMAVGVLASDRDIDSLGSSAAQQQQGSSNVRVLDIASAGRRKAVSQRTLSVGQQIQATRSLASPRQGYQFSSHAPSTIGSLPGSPHSRALAFASSLRNAPVGTQMLAEGSRRSSLHIPYQNSRGWPAVDVHTSGGGGGGGATPCSPFLTVPDAARLRADSARQRNGQLSAAARDLFLRSRRSVDVGHATRANSTSRPAASAYGILARSHTETMTEAAPGLAPGALLQGGGGSGAERTKGPQGSRPSFSQLSRSSIHRCSATSFATIAAAPSMDVGGEVYGASSAAAAAGAGADSDLTRLHHPASPPASSLAAAAPSLSTAAHGGTRHNTDTPGEKGQNGRGGAANTNSAAVAAAAGVISLPEVSIGPAIQSPTQRESLGVSFDERGVVSRPSKSLLAPASSNGRGVQSWANAILARVSSLPRSSRKPAAAAAGFLATGGTAAGSSMGEFLELSTGSLAHPQSPQRAKQDPRDRQPQQLCELLQPALKERAERQHQQQQQESAAAAAASSLEGCWHEIWATTASDPITGQDVLVMSQHDVTTKVIAERHLALVMEAEHRLLEQLFPKHILTHVTEEWMAEAERAAAAGGGAAAAVAAAAAAAHSQPTGPAAAGGAARSAAPNGSGSEWRPVVRDCNALATWHPEVTLLFADIKGFTPMCKQVTPREVMTMLNDLFSRFDAMLDKFGVFKVETIGDCYFVAGGLITEDEDGMAAVRDGDTRGDPLHAHKVFMFAKAMLAAARQVRMPSSGEPVQIRIGISSGPVVSGVVGTRMPRFCLFGDTVNTTSRMESTGQPGAIHASESAYSLLRSEVWEPTGGIEVKGKGLLQTFLWRPILEAQCTTIRQMPASSASAAVAAVSALKLRLGGGGGLALSSIGCSVPYSGSGSAADNTQAVTASRTGSVTAAAAAAAAATAATADSDAINMTVAANAAVAAAAALQSAVGASSKPTGASNLVDDDDDSDPLVAMLLNHAD